MVAADFTLYSNPINRAIYRGMQTAHQPAAKPPPSSHHPQSRVASGTASADARPPVRSRLTHLPLGG